MLIKTCRDIPGSEITDPQVFYSRREFIRTASVLSAGLLLPELIVSTTSPVDNIPVPEQFSSKPLPVSARNDVISYNNYAEFSTSKHEPAELAQSLIVNPWTIEISGAVEKPGNYHFEDILKHVNIEERIYRFRCVEAWSMVVPWQGFTLSALLRRMKPTSTAKFVEFTAFHHAPGTSQNRARPYVEGLRIDEAMHPLAFLATGMYGEDLSKQNGAPLRLIVPWKYGFKSIKAIVKIRLLETLPVTTWHFSAPNEYGFYANVNPDVDHPRWSQRRERMLGSSMLVPKRMTEKFNGYGEQVAGLYSTMDLTRFI